MLEHPKVPARLQGATKNVTLASANVNQDLKHLGAETPARAATSWKPLHSKVALAIPTAIAKPQVYQAPPQPTAKQWPHPAAPSGGTVMIQQNHTPAYSFQASATSLPAASPTATSLPNVISSPLSSVESSTLIASKTSTIATQASPALKPHEHSPQKTMRGIGKANVISLVVSLVLLFLAAALLAVCILRRKRREKLRNGSGRNSPNNPARNHRIQHLGKTRDTNTLSFYSANKIVDRTMQGFRFDCETGSIISAEENKDDTLDPSMVLPTPQIAVNHSDMSLPEWRSHNPLQEAHNLPPQEGKMDPSTLKIPQLIRPTSAQSLVSQYSKASTEDMPDSTRQPIISFDPRLSGQRERFSTPKPPVVL